MEVAWISVILIITLGFACASALEVMLDMGKEKKKRRALSWILFFLVLSLVYVYHLYMFLFVLVPIYLVIQKFYKNEKEYGIRLKCL